MFFFLIIGAWKTISDDEKIGCFIINLNLLQREIDNIHRRYWEVSLLFSRMRIEILLCRYGLHLQICLGLDFLVVFFDP